jgi:hypothetical protein
MKHSRCLAADFISATITLLVTVAACLGADDRTTSVIFWNQYGVYPQPQFSNAVAIAAGGSGALVLTDDGAVLPMQTGPNTLMLDYMPSGLSNAVMVSAGDEHGFVLHANSTVTSWGERVFSTNAEASLTNFVSIDCGWGSNLGLLSDGRVALWGYHYIDTNYPPELTNVVDVSAGHRHFAALRGDGTVVSWGNSKPGVTNVPSDLANVTAISCGAYHTLALRRDGSVVAWGESVSGKTNVSSMASNVVAVAAGYQHGLALRSDGHVVGWGSGFASGGEVSSFSNVVSVAGGSTYSLAIVSSNSPAPSLELTQPSIEHGRLYATFSTQRGRRYFVEGSSDLATNSWQALPAIAGDGSVQQLTVPCETNSCQYFRVRSQQ